ncbi:MAG: hypothetical protein WCX80_05325, partial [Patescibacteria group bacterium]
QFLDLPSQIFTLAVDSKDLILKVAAIIYLLGRVSKADIKKIRSFLKITEGKMNDIINELSRVDLLYKNQDVVIFRAIETEINKQDVGNLIVEAIVKKIDIDALIKLFPEQNRKKNIYGNLGKVASPLVNKHFHKDIQEIIKNV